jgi:hypothetical protein
MGCVAEQMFASQNMSLLSSAFVMYSVVKSIHFKDKCPCSVPYFLAQLPKDHQLVRASGFADIVSGLQQSRD